MLKKILMMTLMTCASTSFIIDSAHASGAPFAFSGLWSTLRGHSLTCKNQDASKYEIKYPAHLNFSDDESFNAQIRFDGQKDPHFVTHLSEKLSERVNDRMWAITLQDWQTPTNSVHLSIHFDENGKINRARASILDHYNQGLSDFGYVMDCQGENIDFR